MRAHLIGGWPRRVLLMCAALAVAAAPACSGGHSPGVASLGPATPSPSAAPRPDYHQALVNWAACVRSHGVPDFPTPAPNGGFVVRNAGSPQLRKAAQVCSRLSPVPAPDASDRAQMLANQLNFARCMRLHGVKYPQPGPAAANGTSLPDTPQVRAAFGACAKQVYGQTGGQ